jgi:hypothetical protein
MELEHTQRCQHVDSSPSVIGTPKAEPALKPFDHLIVIRQDLRSVRAVAVPYGFCTYCLPLPARLGLDKPAHG